MGGRGGNTVTSAKIPRGPRRTMWDASTLTVLPETIFDKVVFKHRLAMQRDLENEGGIHTVTSAKIPRGPRRTMWDASTLTVFPEATFDTVVFASSEVRQTCDEYFRA